LVIFQARATREISVISCACSTFEVDNFHGVVPARHSSSQGNASDHQPGQQDVEGFLDVSAAKAERRGIGVQVVIVFDGFGLKC